MEPNNTGIIWVRVSTEEQCHGYSPDSQKKLLTKFAEEKEIDVVEVFAFPETASKYKQRKKFKAMLAFIKEQNIQHLVAEKTDRLLRNPYDVAAVYELVDNGLKVHLVKEGLHLDKDSNANETFSFGIYAAVAQYIGRLIGQEARKGMQEKAEQGGLPCLAPLGYLNIADPNDPETDPKKKRRIVIVDEDRKVFIIEAFELYDTGNYSLSSLCEHLNKRGLRTKKGMPLTKHGLQSVLRNRFYCGEVSWGGKIWQGTHQPLNSKELFLRVQDRLSKNVFNPKGPDGKNFYFKPFLRCGYCRHQITANIQKGHVYYSCSQAHVKEDGRKKCGKAFYYTQEKIDNMFAEAIGDLYVNDNIVQMVSEELRKSHFEQERSFKNELKRLQAEQARKHRQLGNLIDRLTEGRINDEEYDGKRLQYQDQLSFVNSELAKLQKRNIHFMEETSTLFELLKGFKAIYLRQELKERAKILEIVLEKCYLRGKDLEDSHIVWRPPFDSLFDISRLFRENEAEVIKEGIRGE